MRGSEASNGLPHNKRLAGQQGDDKGGVWGARNLVGGGIRGRPEVVERGEIPVHRTRKRCRCGG